MVEFDEENDEGYVMMLIEDLAMSRSNNMSAQRRGDLMKLVEKSLSEKPGCRRALAESEGKILVCLVHTDHFADYF
jgi:hypothetical protein